MSYYPISAFASSLVSLILGCFVYFKNRKGNLNRVLGLLSVSIALWAFGVGILFSAEDKATALFWNRLSHVGAIFIPIFFLHFVIILLDIYKKKKRMLVITYLIGAVFTPLSFTPSFIKDEVARLSFRYYPEPAIIYPFFTLIFFYFFAYGSYLLVKSYKTSLGFKRNQIKYVFLAWIIGVVGGSTTFFPVFNIPIPPFGIPFVALYPIIIAYAIVQYRLMEIEVIIRKALVFTGVYAPIFALFFLITFYGQRGIYETFGLFGMRVNPWVLVALGAAFVAITIRPLNNFLVRKTDRFLFQKKYDYQKVLKDASRGMARIVELKHLLGLIVHFISARVRVEHTAILLRNKGGDRYVFQASRGYHERPAGTHLASDSAMVKWFQERRDVILYGEIDHFLRSGSLPKGKVYSKKTLAEIKEEMAKLKAAVCIPSFIRHDLIGILMLILVLL